MFASAAEARHGDRGRHGQHLKSGLRDDFLVWGEDRLTEILRDGRPRVHLEGLSLALIELYRRAVDAIR